MKHLFVFISLCWLSSQVLLGEGYQVNLQGQKQTGMGHTGTGLLLGPSSLHFNPAALSFLEGRINFSAGASGVLSNNTFVKNQPSVYEAKTNNPMGTPFYLYGSGKISDNMAVGIGVNTPYGNSLKWDEGWDGRYLIQDISLQAIFVQPTISYAVAPFLSIGGGPVLALGSVDLSKALPLQSSEGEGQVNLTGTTTAYGFNVGLFAKINPVLTLGVDYRSKIIMKMEEGEAHFSVPSSMSSSFPEENGFSAELPMPANLSFGLGWQLTDKWLLAFDLQMVEWSAYQSLNFDFEENTPLLADSENVRNFENTMIYRIGAQYQATKNFILRGGVYLDETPIPEGFLTPETPGANKTGFSGGFSWKLLSHLEMDASLLYIKAEDRNDGYAPLNFYGSYSANAWIPGLGLSWQF